MVVDVDVDGGVCFTFFASGIRFEGHEKSIWIIYLYFRFPP